MKNKNHFVEIKKGFKLSEIHTDCCKGKPNKDELNLKLLDDIEEISSLQNKLFAENRQSLLIILQGMDSSGKDSTIKQIMRGINPQGVSIHSFKHPSDLELEHDYLWRHIQKLPERGQICVFNRSYYENVLISKVHPELVLAERLPGISKTADIDSNFWNERYKQITNFEKNCVQNGTQVLKFFLHISKEEQCKRFLARIENKEKHWKFNSSDINERNHWDAYQTAYETVFKKTSTDDAPWHIIPADSKLCAHLLISTIIIETLRTMNPTFPETTSEENELMKKAKLQLTQEQKNTVV